MIVGNTKYIVVTLSSTNYLQNVNYNALGVDYEKVTELVQLGNHSLNELDGGKVSIDTLIETLQTIKENGFNHVNIDYHCDHDELEVTGLSIASPTQDQLDVFLNMQNKKIEAEKQAKIKRLEEQLNKLKSE